MKKTICVLLALSLLCAPALTSARTRIDELEEQKAELRAQREGLQTDIDGLLTEKADVVEQKAALDSQNELARQELELIAEQLELYSRLMRQKSRELEEAQTAEAEQLSAYRARVRAMEEDGKLSVLAILFSSRSLSELLYNLDMVAAIMEADAKAHDELETARRETERVRAEYEAVLAELADKQTELESRRVELEESIAAATALIAAIETDIERYEAEIAANEANEAAAQTEINAITARLRAEEEAARRASEESQTRYTGPGETSTGAFLWPCPSCRVCGDGYGMRMHPLQHVEKMHYGQDIPAQSGAEIVAADGGTVASAMKNGSYGNYVVLYHSGGTTTLYAHMSSMAVSVGDTVERGQVIGYVGQTGWANGPHLHFEVSVGGSRVDPLGYISP